MRMLFSIVAVIAAGSVPAVAAGARTDLETLLQLAGQRVEEFWAGVSGVTCLETLVQSKVDAKGKVLAERRATYDYLILLQAAGADISVEESRIDKSERKPKTAVSLLSSQGFSVLALVLHPHFQSSFEFTDLGAEAVGGLHARKLGFRHIAGEKSPSVLVLKDREYPISWEGAVWLRAGTNEIMRVDARLSAPMEEMGLLKLDTSVSYAAVRFNGEALPHWLPDTATIDAASRRQQWRNIHRFTGYRRFNVETSIQAEGGK